MKKYFVVVLEDFNEAVLRFYGNKKEALAVLNSFLKDNLGKQKEFDIRIKEVK